MRDREMTKARLDALAVLASQLAENGEQEEGTNLVQMTISLTPEERLACLEVLQWSVMASEASTRLRALKAFFLELGA